MIEPVRTSGCFRLAAAGSIAAAKKERRKRAIWPIEVGERAQ